jgi:hypothetical protein
MPVASLRTLLPLGVVCALAAGPSGCGGDRRAVSEYPHAPSDFADAFTADLAGSRDGLALAVAGQLRGRDGSEEVVRVYTRGRNPGWRRAPRLVRRAGHGDHVSVVYSGRIPCVGYESPARARVLACLRRNRWRHLPMNGLPARGRLLKLAAPGGRLVAVLRLSDRIAAFRRATGRWRGVGSRLPIRGAVAVVGESSRASDALELALVDVARGERTVWSLMRGKWRRRPPLRGHGGGPMPGGPVRLGRSIYLPLVDASSEPWRFSAHVLRDGVWSSVNPGLNRDRGSAQGVLRVVGGAVWAAWQENEPRDDGLFNTRMYAQRVAPVASHPREIWSGTSIGPGSIETVQGAGRRWTLYMPGAPRRRGLTVAVKPLP